MWYSYRVEVDEMRQSRQSRRGFTLIELLIVILIILVLSGILFKLSTLVTYKATVAKATADMENIRNALTEYYSEYGIYPPTTANSYIYECTNWQTRTLQRYLEQNRGRVGDYGGDGEWEEGKHIGYQYGLVSHLYLRNRNSQAHPYRADNARDKAAKRRWAEYLSTLSLRESGEKHKRLEDFRARDGDTTKPDWGIRGPQLDGVGKQLYFNAQATLVDPWDRAYNYKCRPPYQAYDLWCNGPDRKSGTADDIGR